MDGFDPMSEQAVVFGKGARLVGILSRPAGSHRQAAVVMANSGVVHRVGANRTSVILARSLAEQGYDSLRFDMSGLGDSSERFDNLNWENSAPLELSEAIDVLDDRRSGRPIVMYGNCGGAAKSFWTALCDDRVRGLVATNPPPHPADLESAKGSPHAERAAAEIGRDLARLFDRGLQAIFIYAQGDVGLDYFERRLRGALGRPLADGRLTIATVERSNHTFALAPARRMLTETICSWLDERFGARTDGQGPEHVRYRR
jgi:pimeloyl-ACP methyl ester carboxylesterase